jgi:hypothetical protein
MLSSLRAERIARTEVHIVYRGHDAIGSVMKCPVLPDDPEFFMFKHIAQLKHKRRILGEYHTLKQAMDAINEATK